MTVRIIDRLHRLSAIWGPSGREQKVARELQEMLQPFVPESSIDRFGNLIARRPGAAGGRRVMLAAHMDTVGALALEVTERGLIKLAPVGELKAHHAIGQRVVWGSGAVGVLQHPQVDEPGAIEFGKLWCDIGAVSREEALQSVRLGDMCTLVGDLQAMGDTLCGPGLADRAACAVLVEVAEHLTDTDHEVVFAFTAQGEVGQRGAGPAAYMAEPELAFVVGLSAAGDLPGAPRVDLKLGQGPAIKLKDGGFMAHQPLADLVRAVAREHLIPLQTEIAQAGRTEGQPISISRQGVATAAIAIAARYRGTGNEMVNTRDLHGAADLLLKLLQDPLEL